MRALSPQEHRPPGINKTGYLGGSLLLALVFFSMPFLIQQPTHAQPFVMANSDAEIVPFHEVATKLENLFSPRSRKHAYSSSSFSPYSFPWTLHKLDHAEPTVTVAGHRGFQIILNRTWKESTNLPQQHVRANVSPGPFRLHHAQWQFILFPIRPQKAPAGIKSQIPWQKSNSPFHTRNVYLGEGYGYVWFTHGTLDGQELIRRELKLQGGDDRIELLLDGLTVNDKGKNTSNSCLPSLKAISKQQGNKILPYFEKKLAEPLTGDQLRRVLKCLSDTPTNRVTDLLLKYYSSETKHFRSAARRALTSGPFREQAKPAYLDMLRRQDSLDRVCAACIYFQWKEALPILRALSTKPKHPNHLLLIISTRRTLEGNPIPKHLLETERTLQMAGAIEARPELAHKINAARQLLIESTDAEVANTIALNLVIWHGFKASSKVVDPVNRTGVEILKARPHQSTRDFLRRTIGFNDSSHQSKKIKAIFTVLESQAPTRP